MSRHAISSILFIYSTRIWGAEGSSYYGNFRCTTFMVAFPLYQYYPGTFAQKRAIWKEINFVA